MQAPHLQGTYLWSSEAAIMMCGDTKKDGHRRVEIHYNYSRHELTPRGGGASEGCRPKLPRWPFSGSSRTQASGTAVDRSMVREPRLESQAFLYSVTHCCLTNRRASHGLSLYPTPHLQASRLRRNINRLKEKKSFRVPTRG